MQWFRFHAEALNDPKVQALDGELFKVWVNLLCMQCAGLSVTRDSTVTFALRVTVEKWHVTRDRLRDAGLLDPETGEINGWKKRQYISDIKDRTAAERQRRRRAKLRADRDTTVTSRLPDTDTENKDSKKDKENYKKKTEKKPQQKFEIPDWVPPAAWADFVEHRIKLRKAMSAGAMRLTVSSLAKLMRDGHPAEEVLNQSIQRGWAGVFEIKKENGNGNFNGTHGTAGAGNKHERAKAALRQSAIDLGYAGE